MSGKPTDKLTDGERPIEDKKSDEPRQLWRLANWPIYKVIRVPEKLLN